MPIYLFFTFLFRLRTFLRHAAVVLSIIAFRRFCSDIDYYLRRRLSMPLYFILMPLLMIDFFASR